jgi:cytochrome c nitrite reductase small subunit
VLRQEQSAALFALLASAVRALTRRRSLLLAGALWTALPLVFLFGPPEFYEYSQSPGFCAACHVMQPQHASWTRMGKHREKTCVDCHLANRHWTSRLLRMGIDGGVGTAAFVSGMSRDPIRLSAHGRRTVQANCIRCHAEMVSRIDAARACWDCHRRATHVGAARIAER